MKRAFSFLALLHCILAAPKNHLSDNKAPFIVGGQDAIPNEFPFMVSMQFLRSGGFSHHCGGAILNERWVVSASHCVENGRPATTRIAAGLQSLTIPAGTEQYSDVTAFYMHPDYDTRTLENDIVLIKLTDPLDFALGKVDKINLPLQDQDTAAKTNSTVIGWGNLQFNNPNRPDILQKVSIPIVTDEECRQAYGPEDMFDSFICAGVVEGGLDSCNGDSGGPLFTHEPVELIGVVSWGKDCALPGYYGVYTEVSFFVDWIEATIAANSE